MDWQTWVAIAAAVFAGGSLWVAWLSLRHTRRASAENAAAVANAQHTADEANAVAKERLHADVLPALTFTRHDDARTTSIHFENTGSGPAHDIEIDAHVLIDAGDQQQKVKSLLEQWLRECQGTTLQPGERRNLNNSHNERLQFIAVRRLAYRDAKGKLYEYAGKANALRPLKSGDEAAKE